MEPTSWTGRASEPEVAATLATIAAAEAAFRQARKEAEVRRAELERRTKAAAPSVTRKSRPGAGCGRLATRWSRSAPRRWRAPT